MGTPDLRLLASASSRPQLNVIELATGEVAPSPVPVDNTVAGISSCCLRERWLAIDAGEEVWGVPLPLQGRAFKLADSFTCLPGAGGRTVWAQPDTENHDRLLEFDGAAQAVVREVQFTTPVTVCADVGSGLVARGWSDDEGPTGDLHLYDYAGRQGELVAADADVHASQGAQLLVLNGDGTLTLIDVDTARRTPIEVPGSVEFAIHDASFSPDGSRIALTFELGTADPERDRMLERIGQLHLELADRGVSGLDLFEEIERQIPGWQELASPGSEAHRLAIIETASDSVTVVDGELKDFTLGLTWSADGQQLVFATSLDERGLWLWQTGADALERIAFKRSMPAPLLDVSDESEFGNLSVSTLRALQRPSWRGPIPPAERERLLAASRDQVEASAAQAGLPASALAGSCEAIRIRSCVAGRSVAVGASRLGGRPDLPAGYTWPRYEGDPMTFLGQLRVEELRAALPSAPLPQDGLLVAFVAIEADGTYTPEDDCVHVAIVPETGLKRRPWPTQLDPGLRYEHALAVAEPLYSPPSRAELLEDHPEDVVERFESLCAPSGPNHQLFGSPRTIQQTQAPDGHRLLFEFDGDALLGAEFGDGGRLYIWCPDGGSDAGADLGDCLVDDDSH